MKALNIICLLKIVEDMDDISISEYKQADNGVIDTSYVKKVMNCFDEAALENALRIKDQRNALGLETDVTVISLNPGYAVHMLEPLYAIGVNQVIAIECDSEVQFFPDLTAELILRGARERQALDGIHVYFAGRQAPPLNSALVPVYVAENLGYPLIRGVRSISASKEGMFVERRLEDGVERLTVEQDTVVVFDNTEYSYLRVPTLREKMRYKHLKPSVFRYDIVKPSSDFKFNCAKEDRVCEYLTGKSDRELAEKLLKCIQNIGFDMDHTS